MVCTANICRSPLAAMHLQETLTSGPLEGAAIASAGVRGLTGAPMCDVARGGLDDASHADAHRARELDGALIVAADLVITMEREQRGAVARLAPGQQGKVFTIREAAAMVEAVAEAGPLPGTVAELAERMRALRGIVRPPVPAPVQRRGLGRLLARKPSEAADDGLSVEDGHNIDAAAHAATVEDVRRLSGRIGTLLAGQAATR
ncbi:arsenate reductase/protein-tyrosine-phosphatase family protein [Amnibacterium setariae]|nr:hypothetical protein [Amnibacterium setariae]